MLLWSRENKGTRRLALRGFQIYGAEQKEETALPQKRPSLEVGGYSPTLRKPLYEGEIKTLPSGSFRQGGGHSPDSGSPSLRGNTALLSGRPNLTGDPGL